MSDFPVISVEQHLIAGNWGLPVGLVTQAKSGHVEKSVNVWRHHFLVLSLIVFASLAVRVAAFAIWGTGAIENEGAEYARIAENLRNGVGYVGIATPGPELMFPPLFPLLIAAASFVTGNYEWAGRLVSLLAGSLLPLPVFGVASLLFSRRTALVAAVITLLHPLFINLSITVFSEGLYTTLLLSAVYVVLRALHQPSIRLWCLVGGAFGMAYLVRQEAIAPLLIAGLFALTSREGEPATRWKRAAAAVAVFLVLALPEVLFLYKTTGKVRLEGKSAINFALGMGAMAPQANVDAENSSRDAQREEAQNVAGYAINANLEGSGVWMRPNVEVVRETRIPLRQLTYFVGKAVRQNTATLLQYLSSRWLGAPFLPALALLGALRRPWRRPLAYSHLFFVLVPATAIVATFSVAHRVFERNYFVLVPFLSIWAANGLVEVGRWMKGSSAAVGCRWCSPAVSGCIVPGLIALAVVIYPLKGEKSKGVRNLGEFIEGSASSRPEKNVGMWIRERQSGPVKIMDLYTPLAFHADAQYVHFPYCSADLALRFLDAAKVDYVVLRRGERFAPYYEDWVTGGIPDTKAQLVYGSLGAGAGDFVVFRWRRAD